MPIASSIHDGPTLGTLPPMPEHEALFSSQETFWSGLPENECKQQEINTRPLKSGWNQEIFVTVYCLLNFISSPTPLCFIKETNIQTWARCFFGTLAHYLLGLLGYQIRLLFFARITHFSIYWLVMWWRDELGLSNKRKHKVGPLHSICGYYGEEMCSMNSSEEWRTQWLDIQTRQCCDRQAWETKAKVLYYKGQGHRGLCRLKSPLFFDMPQSWGEHIQEKKGNTGLDRKVNQKLSRNRLRGRPTPVVFTSLHHSFLTCKGKIIIIPPSLGRIWNLYLMKGNCHFYYGKTLRMSRFWGKGRRSFMGEQQ